MKEKMLETIKKYMEFYPPVTSYNSIGYLSVSEYDAEEWTDKILVSKEIFPLLILMYREGKLTEGDFFISIESEKYNMGRGFYPWLNLVFRSGKLTSFIPMGDFSAPRMFTVLDTIADSETEIYTGFGDNWISYEQYKKKGGR